MSDTVKIEITQDLIKPIIENKIKAAIVEAMGKENQLLESIVTTMINLKVNSEGKVDKYDSYNKYNFLDIVLQNGIQEAIKSAIKDFVNENKQLIKQEVIRQMSTKKGLGEFVSSFLNGMFKAAESNYKIKTEFKFETE